jgi:hypothetical protein
MKLTILSAFLVLLVAGCGRDQIQTYQVPKDAAAVPVPAVGRSAQPSTADGFTAELPSGWTEVPSSSAMRMASYDIEGTEIDFYLIALSMGDIAGNVNRWRGQVGLPGATAEAIAQDVKSFTVDGHAGSYVELYNEEEGLGIIAAIIDRSPSYWYFTAKGSVDELKSHAADIQAYLASIQFEGNDH